MRQVPKWWSKPRRVSVVVDNPSWILPYAEELVGLFNRAGDRAFLCRTHEEIEEGQVAFYLGCTRKTSLQVLRRSRRNLVIHESSLPLGRGFSPLTWQILEGRNEIGVCLFEAAQEIDAGPVIYRDRLVFGGHELIDEMRDAQARLTLRLCQRFMNERVPPEGETQSGDATYYRRRSPEDSRLDPYRTLAEQFNLLRVVDNERYPAFIDYQGRRYVLKIERAQAAPRSKALAGEA